MSFATDTSADAPPTVAERVRAGLNDYATVVRYAALLVLFVLVWALMFRPIQKQMLTTMKELKGAGTTPALAGGSAALMVDAGVLTALPAAEGEAEIVAARRKLADLVQAEPAAMTRTLQSWLREDTA